VLLSIGAVTSSLINHCSGANVILHFTDHSQISFTNAKFNLLSPPSSLHSRLPLTGPFLLSPHFDSILAMGRYHPKRLLLAALVLLLIYVQIRHSQSDDFYTKTVKALNKKTKDKAWKEETDAKVQKILDENKAPEVTTTLAEPQPAAAVASDSIQRLPPSPPAPPTQSQDDDDKRQKKLPADKPKYIKDSTTSSSSPLSSKPTSLADPPHLTETRAALDEIIHHHSIVIFSKTYCPHSRRAKSLLLETYDIVPKPFVVELDTLTEAAEGKTSRTEGEAKEENALTMGKALQDLLAQRTGRKTVPNILVLGMSIGGADEVVKLDEGGSLADKLKGMVGKRLERCEKRRPEGKSGHGAL